VSSIGRNEPCPCGSGKKYKHCCATKAAKAPLASRITISLIALLLLGGAVYMLTSLDDEAGLGARRVWSEEHGHWH
jgi:hypothetical protein